MKTLSKYLRLPVWWPKSVRTEGEVSKSSEMQPTHSAAGWRRAVSYVIWPGLLATALTLTGLGMQTDYPVLVFNAVYVAFALTVGLFERLLPHEQTWLENDHQTLANLSHTLLNKGLVQVAVVVSAAVGAAAVVDPSEASYAIWPESWPLWAQAVLGLAVAEFGLYWAHRLAHEIPFLWRFHAVHHSVTRLWFINTGRFHFVDTFWSILLSQPLLYVLGAPLDVFLWVSATTAFIGILTHCNIETRTGYLDLVFNTPQLHRWHHSMKLEEGNRNYGENLMLWDQLFGTYYDDPSRRPPARIGIHEPMPARFRDQLVYPFRSPPAEERSATE
ncbi:Sterol desaturase [Tepidicaulis marinus]|uniref:Sterol desaturase n=1 Tax=Tepidicaulis marinus TaxID=1333998 RepID=A0A081BD91_9HYPH|nr:Sterol desaturase [Tepidicaulis marinus]